MVLDYSRLFCFNINMEYQGKAFSLVVSDTTLNMVEISLYLHKHKKAEGLEYVTNMNQM